MKKHPEIAENVDDARGGIQVIARATKIMRALSANPQGLSLAGIAMEVGLPRSTVQRIVYALEMDDIVEPVGPGGGFRLGPALGQIMQQTQADIVSTIRPYLEHLSLQLRETACLSRAAGNQNDILDQFVGEQPLRIVLPLGIVDAPLQATASGKVLLARMSDDKVLDNLNSSLSATQNPRSVAALLDELAAIRQSGFAYDNGEFTEGVSAVSTSIGTYRGAYALTVLAPTSRMQYKVAEVRSALHDTKSIIERLVGVS